VNEGSALRFKGTWMRLTRRAVRDYNFRGTDVEETLEMWANVRRGEKLYISPYKENADLMFDSSLAFEYALLKPYVVPLLEQIPKGKYPFVDEMLENYKLIEEMDSTLVAENSLSREFIGGSSYTSY
jgi:uridine kinase